MTTPKIIFVQNLIAPYRVELFNQLACRGLSFQLYFMSKNEKGRSWKIDLNCQHYPYHIFKGLHISLGKYQFHFNPGMILKLLCQPRATTVILGGAWNDFNILCLSLLKRLHILRVKVFFWSEANYMSQGVLSADALKYHLRKFILNTADGGIIYPGTTAYQTLEKWGIRKGRRIRLPNCVQETQICNAPPLEGWTHNLPNIVIPARLSEMEKGQLSFFMALGDALIRRARFHLFGDGPDEGRMRQFIRSHHLEEHIILYGFCDFGRTASAMKAADVFCLPSFTDCCPLSVYEAMACRLPLLLSSRCGNAQDAVMDSDCGECFDPNHPDTIRNAYQKMLKRSKEWKEMAKIAYKRFQHEISVDATCPSFVKEIQK